MRGSVPCSLLFSFSCYSLTPGFRRYLCERPHYLREDRGSAQLLNYQASGKSAGEALFPSPTGSILFLWTQISEHSTRNNKQHIFPWARIKCRKESIYILYILLYIELLLFKDILMYSFQANFMIRVVLLQFQLCWYTEMISVFFQIYFFNGFNKHTQK